MDYIVTFLEGIVSFISPCMLPMLPLYLTYFAGGDKQKDAKVLARVGSFIAGFTAVFSLMGLFAGILGGFLHKYQTVLNIVCGAVVVLLGLGYLQIIPLGFLKGMKSGRKASSVLSAFLFGMVYSVSLTPCVGVFLGSALMLAGSSGTALKGCALLVIYSLGLGVPFLLSAWLLDELKGAFDFIKKHYAVINRICGIFLILLGIMMACGGMERLLSFVGGN